VPTRRNLHRAGRIVVVAALLVAGYFMFIGPDVSYETGRPFLLAAIVLSLGLGFDDWNQSREMES
jgi:Na+/proline symporter